MAGIVSLRPTKMKEELALEMTDDQAGVEKPVLTERRGNVLLITLNRPPPVRNAVNAALAAGVAGALEELDADGGLSVGAALTARRLLFKRRDQPGPREGGHVSLSAWFGDRGFAGIAQRSARKPLIAAIEGFALAGGLEIALACDLIVAARGARMGIPEAKRSLVAAGGALLRLPRRIPYHVVMVFALTGDPMPAERFEQAGLVNRLADPGAAVEVALEVAGQRRRQRAARADRLQADPAGAVRLEQRRDVGAPERDLRSCVRLRGRQGGRGGVQGEARAGLAGA